MQLHHLFFLKISCNSKVPVILYTGTLLYKEDSLWN